MKKNIIMRYLEELKNKDTTKTMNFILHFLKNMDFFKAHISKDLIISISAIFLFIKSDKNLINEGPEIVSRLFFEKHNILYNDEINDFFNKIDRRTWNDITDFACSIDSGELQALILYCPDIGNFDGLGTRECISELSLGILDIKESDSVLDLCCGTGTFLIKAYAENPDACYKGIDINRQNIISTQIKSMVLDAENIKADCQNVWKYEDKADKIFMHYSFGMRMLKGEKEQYIHKLKFPEKCMRISADDMFIKSALNTMKEKGKAVILVPSVFCDSLMEKEFREYLINDGYLEAVIMLPERLLYRSGISISILVLSENNEKVKLIDARKIFTKSRIYNTLSDENINEILKLYNNGGESVTFKDNEELSQNGFNINPSLYLETLAKLNEIKNGVAFKEIIKNVKRGNQLINRNLEELKSEKPTNFRFIKVSNIANGYFEKDSCLYLKEISENEEKFCLPAKSIVISKAGVIKSAVIEKEENEEILADGNMYIIEIDESKADIYYVQAFLNSGFMEKIFASLNSGRTFAHLSLKDLNNLIIPLPPIEEQHKTGEKYLKTLNKIINLNKELVNLNKKIKTIYK